MDRPPGKISDERLRQFYDLSALRRRFSPERDLIRYLYEHEYLSQRQISVVLRCGASTVARKMRKYGISARSNAAQAIVSHGYAHERRDFDGDDKLRSYMLGFAKGDLYVVKQCEGSETIIASSSTTKQEQIALVKEVFGSFGHFYTRTVDEEGHSGFVVHLNLTFDFLLDLPDEIPAWILRDDELFFAFLAGYVDAEGHIGTQGHSAYLRIASYDRQILHQIYTRLVQLKFQCPAPQISRPRGHSDKHGFTTSADYWRLAIGIKETLLRLFGRLAPYMHHAKRIRDMQEAIQCIGEIVSLPNGELPALPHRASGSLTNAQLRRIYDLTMLRWWFPHERDLMRYLYEREELTQREVGIVLGISESNVGYKLRKYDIPIRSRAAAQILSNKRERENAKMVLQEVADTSSTAPNSPRWLKGLADLLGVQIVSKE